MANKYFYYVVVLSEGQAKFITSVDNKTKYAHWEKDKVPMLFAKSYAEDMAYCLSLNFYPAFVLQSYHKIESQIFYKAMDAERLKTLLYNALTRIEEDCSDFFATEVDDEYYWFEKTIGITEEEIKELGITLSKGENENEDICSET